MRVVLWFWLFMMGVSLMLAAFVALLFALAGVSALAALIALLFVVPTFFALAMAWGEWTLRKAIGR